MLNRRQFLSGLGVSSLGHGAFASAKSIPILDQLEKLDANILFMRHALAPGFGDPDTFDVTRCSTQRNLDSRGRAQAIALGQAFKKSKVTFDAVFSSQWCRCKETATLLNMGPVQEFAGLNSFFQGHARRGQTLQKLEQRLANLGPLGLYLMVTHQVVIQAVTQLTVASGECVAYNFQTKQAIEIKVD